MAGQLFVEERRRVILEQLKQHGRVSVKELGERLNVSAVTIRQDLRALEKSDLLERTYGGAVLPATKQASPELSFDMRQRTNQNAKTAIAEAAAHMVQSGYSIALDASTTAFALLPHLKQLERLIIVTNSLIVALNLLDSPHIQVLMPGGRLRRDSIALVGRPDTLPDINLNIGFFGTRGITLAKGMTETDANEAAVKQALLARCLTNVIVASHDKWNKVAPYTFANPDQVQTILTTTDAPSAQVEQFRKRGVEVITVPVSETV